MFEIMSYLMSEVMAGNMLALGTLLFSFSFVAYLYTILSATFIDSDPEIGAIASDIFMYAGMVASMLGFLELILGS